MKIHNFQCKKIAPRKTPACPARITQKKYNNELLRNTVQKEFFKTKIFEQHRSKTHEGDPAHGGCSSK